MATKQWSKDIGNKWLHFVLEFICICCIYSCTHFFQDIHNTGSPLVTCFWSRKKALYVWWNMCNCRRLIPIKSVTNMHKIQVKSMYFQTFWFKFKTVYLQGLYSYRLCISRPCYSPDYYFKGSWIWRSHVIHAHKLVK